MTSLAPIRLALRTVGRSPLFAVTAIASLALGLAASATIFGLADALFFRPRAGIHDESRLVDVARATRGEGFDNIGYQVLLALRGARQIEGIAGYRFGGASAISLDNGRGGSDRAFATPVTANYFAVLGTRAAAGRFFRPDEDDVPDAAPVTVLSHAFWVSRFGADAGAVGSTLRVNGRPYVVIGVAEPGFHGTTFTGTDLWVPFAMAPHILGRGDHELLTEHGPVWHLAIARLTPGATAAQVRDELDARLAPLRTTHPEAYEGWSIEVRPSSRIPGDFRAPAGLFLGMLFTLTALVLAIACSNVAGTLLARGLARQREWATRLAVGASRRQLIQQLLWEALALTGVAAIAGVLLTWWATTALLALLPDLPIPIVIDVSMDLRVLAFVLGIMVITTLGAGLGPALQSTRVDLAPSLHGQHATAGRRGLRLRHALVGAQVALSVVLLVATGLFARSLQAAAVADTGYDAPDVHIVTIDTALGGYRDQRAVTVADALAERLAAMPGVEGVASSRMIPLQGGTFGLGALRVPGYQAQDGTEVLRADWDVISPSYFSVLGIPMREGRAFNAADRDGRPDVAIVNEAFASRAWPDGQAVGRVIHQATARNRVDRPLTVVGVARDTRHRSVHEPARPFIYVPHAQQPMTELNFYVRAPGAPPALTELARAIAEVEPALPVLGRQSFVAATSLGLLPQQLAAALAGVVAMLGLLLSAMGLYGVMTYQAVLRAREMAVRRALGASDAHVWRLTLGQGMAVATAGLVVGMLLAGGAAIGIRSVLVGVTPLDPIAFAAAGLVLGAVAAMACALPAHRAVRSNPATLLRAE